MKYLNQKLVIECLHELNDRQLQERLWMAKDSSKQSSFVEAVEGLFTDSGLGDGLAVGKTGFSKEVESEIRKLEIQLSKVRSRDARAVIDDPAMQKVRDLAASVLKLLNHKSE